MKNLLLTVCLVLLLTSCSKDNDEHPHNYGKIEYRVLSPYQNDHIRIIKYRDAGDGLDFVHNTDVIPPYSIVFNEFYNNTPKIEAWRSSRAPGELTVEVYLNDDLVDSMTVTKADYVATGSFQIPFF